MSSPKSKTEFAEEKRKLLYWIAQWTDEQENLDGINVDIPQLTLLFQNIGFRLESYSKETTPENMLSSRESLDMANKQMVQIDLKCSTSGMKSTLIKPKHSCKCPSEEQAESGQFWSVVGCGPSSRNSINSSNSNLIPTISSAKTRIVGALLARVLMIINCTDAAKNDEICQPVKNTTILTRHRSLDTLKSHEDAVLVPKGLKRGPSWEVDPKTTPPKRTSSPFPGLCNSISQISLSSGNANGIVKNLESIKKLVDETLELASGSNATFVKNTIPTKRISDIRPADDACTSNLIQLSTPASHRVGKRKMLTPKKKLSSEKKIVSDSKKTLIAPSRIAMFRKKVSTTAVSPVSPRSPRLENPRPRLLLKQSAGTSGSCDSIFKSKVTGGAKITSSSKESKENEAGSSGISRLRSARKLPFNAITSIRKK